jgi:selT/selW/selH-like putative selenoprotein
LAQAIVNEFRPTAGQVNPVEEIVLVPGSKGMYEITVDGQLVYSKLKTGQHLSDDAAIQLIRAARFG